MTPSESAFSVQSLGSFWDISSVQNALRRVPLRECSHAETQKHKSYYKLEPTCLHV